MWNKWCIEYCKPTTTHQPIKEQYYHIIIYICILYLVGLEHFHSQWDIDKLVIHERSPCVCMKWNQICPP